MGVRFSHPLLLKPGNLGNQGFPFFVFQTKKKLHVRDFFHPYVIADLRKEKQMTQAELAERLHVTDKAVSRWKRGLDIRISIR